MIIGVLKEAQPGETRVAATPESVGRLIDLGYEVVVDRDAGRGSDFSDRAYFEAGASIGSAAAADVVLGVNAPAPDQLSALKPGATLVSILRPALAPGLVDDLAARPITALAMDAVPRISRAQSLDVLSSMANIAGYRSVIEAAHAFGRFFTGQVTAAGKVPPARVLVVGAGVAGLAAIGAAGSLGAVVQATDPRPEVADQVRSLGAEFLSVAAHDERDATSTTGYATTMSADYNARAEALYRASVPATDILITTALIPGRPAPRLITAEMVATMRPGSVIVDLAADNGGNVEGTVAGEVVVTDNGVTIIGYTDLAGRLPAQASQLYGTNLVNLFKLTTPGKDGEFALDLSDVVLRAMTVVHFRDGRTEVTWPPPAIAVSAAPPAPAPAPEGAAPAPAAGAVERQQSSPGRLLSSVLAGATAFFAVLALAPPTLEPHLVVFALSIVIGYYVIGRVHHALHTPLMSVTNAISGIIVVGAMLTLAHDQRTVLLLATAATLLAAVNVFGGFAVTRRMLAMFSRS